MPAKHTLHVALTEPIVRHVRREVESGHYATASEAVRQALELLIERDRLAAEARRGAGPGRGAHRG